ncbi:hypothetical protein D9M73_238400 [compost metagenome]
MREQCVVLEHHADVAFVRRHVVDRASGQLDLAGSRGLEACQHHQAGGLAGAGRPEQREEFAFANIQIEVFDDQRFAVIALLHTAEADQHFAGCSARIHLTHTRTFLLDDCRADSLVKGRGGANRGWREIGISRMEGLG